MIQMGVLILCLLVGAYPKVSYHSFKIGKCYEFYYNEDMNVVGIIS